MSQISVEKLVDSLDADARAALETAAAAAARSAHRNVEIAHWLNALTEGATTVALLDATGASVAAIRRELGAALEDLPRDGGASLALSQTLVQLAREAFVIASLAFGRARVAPGHVVLALLDDPGMRPVLRGIAPSLRQIDQAKLEAALRATAERAPAATPGAGGFRPSAEGGARNEFLDLYASDLTAAARDGRIDPVIGRDAEVRQVVDVLMRRRQNNPILIGEAGVGKTAIAEALALEIVAGRLPERLRGVRLLALDLGLLQAGAGVKGEFERRLRGVVDAVKASAEPIILFIDEAHTLMGAGGPAGQGDAANLLKPALARGELRTVAATTFAEYKRYVEKDAALTRRFQPVTVAEPDERRAVAMLRGIADRFEAHHGVTIRHDALVAAVALSARYIPERQLPDKAISLIDTAAVSVALARGGEPEAVRSLEAEDREVEREAAWLARQPSDEVNEARLAAIGRRRAMIAETVAALRARLAEERRFVAEADALEARLGRALGGEEAEMPGEAAGGAEADNVAPFLRADRVDEGRALRAALARSEARLRAAAGDEPLAPRVVDETVVANVVARWTGIPVGKLLASQIALAETLEERLKARVVGQDRALERIAATMRTAQAGLSDPRRPPAVFLLVGMSGTGKTETALALADILYGGPQALTVINMSEFKEEHKVSMLLGSPPGYVGYGEGGVLTEAVRRRPYGVLLLDEIDKAHPGVQDVFYQAFDKGSMRDGEGRDVDFRHTTILMTANSGAELLARLADDPETVPAGDALEALMQEEMKKHFKPAFLGRTTVLPFAPLDEAALAAIVDMQVERVRARVAERYGAELTLSEPARDLLVAAARSSETGARAIEALVARDLLPVLSRFFLETMLGGRRVLALRVAVDDPQGFTVEPTFAPAKPFAESGDGSADQAAFSAAERGAEAPGRQATLP